MSTVWLRPGTLRDWVVEWRARQFRDPVKKLAYLRNVARKDSVGFSHRLPLYLVPVVLMLLFGASRVEMVSDVNAGLRLNNPAKTAKSVKGHTGAGDFKAVWVVENGRDFETFSNGLRVENRFLSPNQSRSYVVFHKGIPGELQTKPAGIVFHTSESALAPFLSDQNAQLTRIGRGLLEYVSQRKAYHFVVDRFGRVFRVVPETDSANHAGNSVWANGDDVFVNLNHSFLGVSFESQTRDIEQGIYLNPAQIHAGRLLVEMLVGKYNLPAGNCITHAQVSIDPQNMTIGYHYDGAGDFPFQQLGVPDNYALPIPSLYVFGFDFDSKFLMYSGNRLWIGMRLSEKRLRQDAESKHLSVEAHKENLRKQYWASMDSLRHLGIIREN